MGGSLTNQMLGQKHPETLFDIFSIIYYTCDLSGYDEYNDLGSGKIITLLKNFILKMKNNYNLRYNPIQKKFLYVSEGKAHEFNNSTFDEYLESLNQDKKFKYEILLDPSDNDLNLVDSVVGLMLNIGVNKNCLDDFNGRIWRTHTYIIDFQNILHILMKSTNPSHFNRTTTKKEKIIYFTTMIQTFCAKKIRERHNVIVVLKSSKYIEIDGFDPVKEIFLGISKSKRNSINLTNNYNENNTSETSDAFLLSNNLNENLFLINLEPESRSSNNFDDFAFWVIAIAFYNYYEKRSLNNNIFLLTNDFQSLYGVDTSSNNKNILNFNNVENIVYYNCVNKDTENSFYINLKKSALEGYLNILREFLEYNDSGNPNSNLSLDQVRNLINRKSYAEYGNHTMMDLLLSNGLDENLVLFSNSSVKYNGFAFFYSAIKYVQYKTFSNYNFTYKNKVKISYTGLNSSYSIEEQDLVNLFS